MRKALESNFSHNILQPFLTSRFSRYFHIHHIIWDIKNPTELWGLAYSFQLRFLVYFAASEASQSSGHRTCGFGVNSSSVSLTRPSPTEPLLTAAGTGLGSRWPRYLRSFQRGASEQSTKLPRWGRVPDVCVTQIIERLKHTVQWALYGSQPGAPSWERSWDPAAVTTEQGGRSLHPRWHRPCSNRGFEFLSQRWSLPHFFPAAPDRRSRGQSHLTLSVRSIMPLKFS